MTEKKTYRIKKGVTPYGGRTLSVLPENEHPTYVSGHVQIGRRNPPGLRRYERDEVEEISPTRA